ncbi:hypothetical protein CWB96_00335 [Pseudoalteromonas citrea]|uniref:Uncharacterized protein n=1 Tax=Pseudoalteromonas citrea TaxID=43655 RepID=A0A5S3XXY0_9GAMM|nr:hypothetical protein [Pseudoalteromonas citrea]TMP46314.1 hypothetical protein CWB97_02330 [Pseudoalteromonas citrea]TMP63090.1 hypothetical protein CWB96_00335 [Pseudoalteromonas citrea]
MADFSMETIRSVDWAKDYLWDVRLIAKDNTGPGQFTKWFPATRVRESLASISSYTFDAFTSSFSVPQSTSGTEIEISFYDDDQHTITHWLKDWINKEIFGEGHYVQTANESVRYLHVRLLNSQREMQKETVYLVVPDGNLDFEGTSESNSREYTMTFKALGVLSQTNP